MNVSCCMESDPGAGEPRHIHPFDYMARTHDHDLLRSVCRVAAAFDQGAVDALVDEVPAEYRGRDLMGDGMRASHKALLAERFERGLMPVAERARMLLG